MDFAEIIRGLEKKSPLIEWLIIDKGKAATETLAFLSNCYARIPQPKKTNIKKRFQKVDQNEVDAIVLELVAHDLLRRLGLQPEWSPTIERLNPDFTFHVNSKRFIADVFLVKSPTKTIKNRGRVIESWDKPWVPAESRAKKIADRISRKSTKYSKLKLPLVLFIFLSDNYLLDNEKVEAALFGKTIADIKQNNRYPNRDSNCLLYENLAAVVVCKWFDTLNIMDEGKRLYCNILHNWATMNPLPLNAFSNFRQIVWETDGILKRPKYTSDKSMVAKFIDKDGIEIKPYSSNEYW